MATPPVRPSSTRPTRTRDVCAASAAAAQVGFRKFDVIHTRNSTDQFARLLCDALWVREVTGIVVSDAIGPWAEFFSSETMFAEELGEVAYFATEVSRG